MIQKMNLEELSDKLTIREVSILAAKVHEKKTTTTKGKRFGMYPITNPEAFKRTKNLEASFWTANEVDFTQDKDDFDAFTDEEKKPLMMAFGFFAIGDGSVASMLAFQMILRAQTFEEQAFYIAQLDNERVHGETYSDMIDILIPNKDDVFNAISNVKSIGDMNGFIEDAMKSESLKEMYVNLAIVEYLLFQPLFCIIFWYRAYKPNKIKQVIFSNELIAKDEAAHCVNGCMNYRSLDDKYKDHEIYEMVDKACKLVDNFSKELCSDINLTQLTHENMMQYTRHVADDLLLRLGHPLRYDVRSPFAWMDYTKLIPKTNFYENTVGEYSRFNKSESKYKNPYTDPVKF